MIKIIQLKIKKVYNISSGAKFCIISTPNLSSWLKLIRTHVKYPNFKNIYYQFYIV